MGQPKIALLLFTILMVPLIGSLSPPPQGLENPPSHDQNIGSANSAPIQDPVTWNNHKPWWTRTSLDKDRNGIHDSLQSVTGIVNVGLSFSRSVTDEDRESISRLGHEIRLELHSVDAILLGSIEQSHVLQLSQLDDVVMVERYGSVVFFGDIQTPSVKARNSSLYPGAWDLGVTGRGVNIALTDTGVDNEHPGLIGKFVAGYDAVCYNPSDPNCILAGFGIRPTDGTFDPDDGNQHGTACMGMASATGMESDGTKSNFTGAAPDAKLIDVRIGTDLGAGPFENYLIEQEFYESAMNGVQWVIDHRDDAWQGAEEEDYGIDIISLSWGIISHESGGSDGSDMHSRILDEAMEAGVTVSVAAGNDGPDNEGLSGMGASSLSITVGATDDKNTIIRDDDSIADYSSRGPRSDNGDGNPVNELKPEISAPGTNIIQAEGCVTSDGCNNFLGGDASENTYTGRGSGTSYATPSVSGVIALVMEANGNLTPLQIKEVLKQTAERRGIPSAPEVDPYWNRDFGYGMVDAHAAVSLALHLRDSGQTENIDPYTQNHLLSVDQAARLADCEGCIHLLGHAWGQMGSVDMVEYRIDGGNWLEVKYGNLSNADDPPSGEEPTNPPEAGPLTPFLWNVVMHPDELSSGAHLIEVRATSGSAHSLPALAFVNGTGGATGSMSLPPVALALVVGVFVIWVAALGFVRLRTDEEIEGLLGLPGSTNAPTPTDRVIDADILSE